MFHGIQTNVFSFLEVKYYVTFKSSVKHSIELFTTIELFHEFRYIVNEGYYIMYMYLEPVTLW